MNERIFEIIQEMNGRVGLQWDDEDKEELAELIVKECGYCADIFAVAGCPVYMDPTETKPSDYIKKHFGVK